MSGHFLRNDIMRIELNEILKGKIHKYKYSELLYKNETE
jgi:hypothetical protein